MRELAIIGSCRTLPRRLSLGMALGALALSCLAIAAPPSRALTEFTPTVYALSTGAGPQAVATGDFNGDGRPDIAAADTGDGTVAVLLGTGGGAFSAAATFPTGAGPVAIAVGDVDKDGHLDLVTADSKGDAVSVLPGKGDGSFAAPVDLATGADPESVILRDLNGDSKLDVVTADAGGDTVSVLLGDGKGGFATHKDIATGAGPTCVAAADLNGDGSLDLVTADMAADTFSVLLGHGDGTFAARTAYVPSTDSYANAKPRAIAITDFNRDGKLDVAVEGSYNDRVSVALGKGDGSFTSGRGWLSWVSGPALCMTDVNLDGVPDMVATSGRLVVRLGSDDGRFYSRDEFDVGPEPSTAWAYACATADLDGDGLPDVITANGTTDSISVLLNSGSHAFAKRGDCDIMGGQSAGTTSVAVADFNEDGKPDIAAGSPFVSIGLSSGNGLFTAGDFGTPDLGQVAMYRPNTDFSTYSVVAGDFDSDGHQDVVAADGTGMMFFPGDGHGHLGAAAQFGRAAETGEERIVAGDVNNDGHLDIVATPGATAAGVDVYLGNGDGTFGAPTAVAAVNGAPMSVFASPIALDDLDNDGDLDIVVGGGGYSSVLMGHGDGTFAAAVTTSAGTFTTSPVSFPENVVAGDFTGDGHDDVFLTSMGGLAKLLVGHGDGTFAAPIAYPLSKQTSGAPAAGDYNGDGRLDLVLVSNTWGDATVLVNQGGGSFVEYPSKVLDQNRSVSSIAAADFNGDGKMDFVALEAQTAHVLLGSGTIPMGASFSVDAGVERTASLDMSVDSTAFGVTEMRFSSGKSDWSAWRPFAGHATFAAAAGDGIRTITMQYRGAHDETIESSHDIIVDQTPPYISYGWSPGWNKDYAWLWISVSDAGSGVTTGLAKIEYRLNGGAWQVMAKKSDVELYVYGNGPTTLDFRCTDALGNVSGIVTLPLKIDAAPPVTTQSGADDRWHNTDVTVTFSAIDAGIGVAKTQHSTDGGSTWVDGTSVTVYAHPAAGQVGGDGTHDILYRSIDTFGHTETAKSCSVKINTTDVTPPTVSQNGADGAWHTSPWKVSFSASDAATGVAGIEYSTDGGATWTAGSAATVTAGGVTTILYRATDDVGNVSPPASCTVSLDTCTPSAQVSSAAKVVRGRSVGLRYLVRDVGGQSPDSVSIRIVNARGKVVRTAHVAGVQVNVGHSYKFRCTLPKGRYRFMVSASDAAGNVQAKAAVNRLIVK